VTKGKIMKQSEKTNVWMLLCGRFHRELLAGTLAILLASGSACAALDKGMTEHTLDNELTVVVVEDHWHPLVAVEVCYRVGSRNDPPGKQGLSHVLEHLTFRRRGAPQTEGADGAEGSGRAHATTNHDTTCYSSSIAQGELQATLGREAQRMKKLNTSGEDLEHEKIIVARERRQLVEGDTWRNFLEAVDDAAYRLHPYRFPTSGWPETLAQITLDDVRAQFTTYYTPSNAVIVIVGDVQYQELSPLIQEFFGAVPARVRPTPTRFAEPAQDAERRLLVAPHAAPRLVAAYHTPPFNNHDRPALEVVTALLAGSDAARLPARLYADDHAQDVGVEYNPLSHDAGLFYIKVALGPRVDFQRTREAVDDALWHLREDGLSPGELDNAKKRLLLDFYREQGPSARASRLAQYALLGLLPQAQSYTEEIDAVTPADVHRVINRYFSPRNRVVGVTGMAHQARERKQTGAAP
jgi:zinc protease